MNNQKKQVAILGGSFDPITLAHLQIASEVYNQFEDIEEVWLVPCGDSREDKKLTPGIHRIEMIKLILKDSLFHDVPIKVNDIEIRENKYIPTYELMKKFNKLYPDVNFHFCIGSDLLKGVRDWKPDGDKLVKEYEFIIMKRPNYDIDESFLPLRSRVINTFIDGSSTNIRERITNFCVRISNGEVFAEKRKKHLAINGLTTVSVIDYIIKNMLYMDEGCYKYIIGEAEKELGLLKLYKGKSDATVPHLSEFMKEEEIYLDNDSDSTITISSSNH